MGGGPLRRFWRTRSGAMRDPAYELPRIRFVGNSVNRRGNGAAPLIQGLHKISDLFTMPNSKTRYG